MIEAGADSVAVISDLIQSPGKSVEEFFSRLGSQVAREDKSYQLDRLPENGIDTTPMPRLLATKPLSMLTKEANEVGENTLRRSLGPVNLITLGIGAIIGAGIFVLTGQAAALHAGPAVALSFILAGITCAFAGLCYAEFASIIPIAGSAYTYGYATLGELVAWIIGWDLVLEYAFGAATVASGWSGYFNSLLEQLHHPPAAAVHDHLWQCALSLQDQMAAGDVAAVDRQRAALPHVAGMFNLVAFWRSSSSRRFW